MDSEMQSQTNPILKSKGDTATDFANTFKA